MVSPFGQEPVLTLRGIDKRFSGTPVLSAVDLDLYPAEIHAIVGANGAGKSTLGKIVAGYYRRDGGQIALDGSERQNWDAADALTAGVAMIHQEIQLVPGLSVADNVFLGIEQRRGGIFRRDNRRAYQELDAQVGFGIPAGAITGSLPLYKQQLAEILRALARGARVIVMDEPTAALGPREADLLHAVMGDLRQKGCAIVYVTHFLEHVLDHCDRVTVLRDGQVVESREMAGLDRAGLVERMLGRAMTASFPRLPTVPEDARTILKVEGLSSLPHVQQAALTVRAGEIVGIAGLVGAGRSELLRAIAAIDLRQTGQVILEGKHLPADSAQVARESGLVMLPEDRRGQGLLLDGTMRENMTLPYLHRFAKCGFISRRAERRAAARHIDAFGIKPADPEIRIRVYSGGNQQKVLLARWLLDSPRIILLDEPSRGVDVGARERIYAGIIEMAREGMGVLLVSSDLEEVLGMSHRVYLMRNRAIEDEIEPGEWTADSLLQALFSVEPEIRS